MFYTSFHIFSCLCIEECRSNAGISISAHFHPHHVERALVNREVQYLITCIPTCTRKILLPLKRTFAVQGKLKTLNSQSIGCFLPADILLLNTFNVHWLIGNAVQGDLCNTLDRLVLSIGIDSELPVGDREADVGRRT